MAYLTDLFTVDTYESFLSSDRTVSGFRETQEGMAERVEEGDSLVCYVKGLSRWSAVLKVLEGPFVDRTPLFLPEVDPFIIRFRVEPTVVLPLEKSVPIKCDDIFDNLSFTRGRETGYWLGPLRRSLQHIEDEDGRFLEAFLRKQAADPSPFPLEPDELEKHRSHHVRRADGTVSVTVPTDDASDVLSDNRSDRESYRIQAELARLGELMGFRVWLPRSDRSAVRTHWVPCDGSLLESLPLNYDDTTLNTIEQIDVIWLKGRSIQRAFEVEHTTAIYSGLLRMADLLALQPNMNISLHIVAPIERRDKVLNEIRRPVFSLIENQPLGERCSFLAYDSVREVMSLPHLGHLSDTVLQEYEDWAE
jgi:predicted RNA-binding protein